MTKTVVFLGPSLPLAEARQLLSDALFLPPCAMGDVLAAVQQHAPPALVIIDGLFERTPAVWHKEILFALSEGVAVFGGGSMGALRAAELHPFGMRGVGHSFAAFASGALEDDDEVAITHLSAEDGYRPMCEAMVNLRHGLALARDAGLLDAAEASALVAAMKRVFYPERSWHALYAQALTLGLAPARVRALQAFIDTHRPDRKADDARAVLQAVRDWHAAGAPPKPPVAFEPTVFWEHQRAYHGQPAGSLPGLRLDRLVDHVRLGIPGRQQVLDEALRSVLAQQTSRQFGALAVDDVAAMARFRRERGLEKPAALRDWMQAQGLDAAQCLSLARDEARERHLHWRLQEEVSREIPRVLQRRGRLAAVSAAVREQWAHMAALGIDTPQASDVASLDAALQWYAGVHGPVHGDLQAHIVERGFGSPQQFMGELVARYLAAHREPMETA